MIREQIEEIIKKALKSEFKFRADEVDIANPDPRFGDFALACHLFAKELKMGPQDIAQKLAESIKDKLITKAEAVDGYLNITIDNEKITKEVLSEIIKQGERYGESSTDKQKILLEYSSPNTNKPLHLGHVRNNALGMSLCRILDAQGKKIIKVQIINDRGIHIIKSMIAYRKWGDNKSPQESGEKGDHFVGKFYVMFEKEFEKEWQEYLEGNQVLDEEKDRTRQKFFSESVIGREAQEALRKWEKGDEEVVALWKKMNQWVYKGFDETYKQLGSEFDKDYYESETYLLGREIIESALKRGVFFEEDGAIWVDLTDIGLDKKILRRSDGTSVYITQDLGLAISRQKEFKFDGMIHVVGHEQEYHFKVLFAVLKKLGYKWARNLRHLSYGLVFLPEGKMKSREGKVVDADNIILQVKELAAQEIKKRFRGITDAELGRRSEAIGMGALKFMLLRVTPSQPIHFNPKEAIKFEGSTGPYVQYAHARISSILEEKALLTSREVSFELLDKPQEKAIVLKLQNYPQIIKDAAQNYNPSLVCNYLLELAHAFNTFYHEHHVLKAENEDLKRARLALIKSVQIVLRNGLFLLGISAPEKM